MASIIDQLQNSLYSLQGNGFNPVSSPANTSNPSWGYSNSPLLPDPANSELQNTYSVDGLPKEQIIIDFNRAALGGITAVKPPSQLDELDYDAPNNYQAGNGGVVSQIYKSSTGRRYKDLGPSEGRY